MTQQEPKFSAGDIVSGPYGRIEIVGRLSYSHPEDYVIRDITDDPNASHCSCIVHNQTALQLYPIDMLEELYEKEEV